jgi:death-on-curing protein
MGVGTSALGSLGAYGYFRRMTDESILFLTVDDVLEFHAVGLADHGGTAGVRDRAALESAVMQPQVTWDGEYLHDDLFSMAAAYAFHIAENQPFLDGNKRAGVMAAVVFLDTNGIRIHEQEDILYLAMIEISSRVMSKGQLANMLRDLAGVGV